MIEVLSIIIAISFFLNALLHLLLIFGFPFGEYVLGGKNIVLPFKMRIISFIFLVIWTIVGISYLNYSQLIYIQVFNRFDRSLIILTTVFLFFAIFSNGLLTKSKK
ncbi:hypothetical protein A5866_002103 [Enterococcus sp. 12C11_DIV0727]|uniref:Uncharacterized protein n=1 Tax=Candidatus Enterococcus lemimoniae TaxID=1834167 RepID=A0ABZ2T891_9ENTE|nr:hypothetical protein A5866_003330 [Enterococcus sp. 12C11_DIV0727]